MKILEVRERLETYGLNGLTDKELMTLLKINRNEKTFAELIQEGNPTARAILNLADRYRSQEEAAKKIKSSNDIFKLFQFLDNEPKEQFWILLLNRQNGIKKKIRTSIGSSDATVVDFKQIMKLALQNDASNVVICHNHPSGNLRPSEEDIKITKQLKAAFTLMDICLLDHVIIGGNIDNQGSRYYSFADEGIL